jgi:hypothetical protein
MRNSVGQSLVEMMVSLVIIGVAIAGITETIWINGFFMYKLGNKLDNIFAARQVLERIGPDIRMARTVGDGITGSDQFPITTDASNVPNNPISSAGWTQAPFTLNNTTLIIQIPVFDSNGFPTIIPKGTGTPAVVLNLPNVDTIVYQVVPDTDPQAPGPYMLQVETFPGLNSTRPLINPAQTVLRGIIGPFDKATGSVLQTFQYEDNSQNLYPTIPASQIPSIIKVIVNLEVKHSTAGGTTSTIMPSTNTVREEFFLRNEVMQN